MAAEAIRSRGRDAYFGCRKGGRIRQDRRCVESSSRLSIIRDMDRLLGFARLTCLAKAGQNRRSRQDLRCDRRRWRRRCSASRSCKNQGGVCAGRYPETRRTLPRIGAFDNDGNPWRHAAREIFGVSAWRTADYTMADRYMAAILADPETPGSMRQRAQVMSQLLTPLLAKK